MRSRRVILPLCGGAAAAAAAATEVPPPQAAERVAIGACCPRPPAALCGVHPGRTGRSAGGPWSSPARAAGWPRRGRRAQTRWLAARGRQAGCTTHSGGCLVWVCGCLRVRRAMGEGTTCKFAACACSAHLLSPAAPTACTKKVALADAHSSLSRLQPSAGVGGCSCAAPSAAGLVCCHCTSAGSFAGCTAAAGRGRVSSGGGSSATDGGGPSAALRRHGSRRG